MLEIQNNSLYFEKKSIYYVEKITSSMEERVKFFSFFLNSKLVKFLRNGTASKVGPFSF